MIVFLGGDTIMKLNFTVLLYGIGLAILGVFLIPFHNTSYAQVTILPNFDPQFAAACSMGTVYPGTGGTACEYSVAEARRGNNAPNGDQELLVRPGGTFSTIVQDQLMWQTTPFSWKLEGTGGGDVTFTVMQGDTYILSTMASEYDVNPNNTSEVYIRLRGATVDSGLSATLTLTKINGQDIMPALIESDGNADYILIQCMDFTQGWSLEGTAQFLVLERPPAAGSAPSFQIKLTEDLNLIPNSCEPTGCCVCGDSQCSITTEAECVDMGGSCSYEGDGTVCDGIDLCTDVPGCCFLDVNGDDPALANRQIDPNKCIETTAFMCSIDGGAFQGVGTSCLIDFPQECSFPPRNVPTMSQWGLIATAGIIGLVALIILIRRKSIV